MTKLAEQGLNPVAIYVTHTDPAGKVPQLAVQKLLKHYLSGDAKYKDTVAGETIDSKVLLGHVVVIPWKGTVEDTMALIGEKLEESGGPLCVLGCSTEMGDNALALRRKMITDWFGKSISYATVNEGANRDESGKIIDDPNSFLATFYFADELSGDTSKEKIEYLQPAPAAKPKTSLPI